jgi:hypothetical protein
MGDGLRLWEDQGEESRGKGEGFDTCSRRAWVEGDNGNKIYSQVVGKKEAADELWAVTT